MQDTQIGTKATAALMKGLNGNTVLVVDDDTDLNQLLGAYVEVAGFRYRSAGDGATALREARAHAPALILLDLMLPDTDGFDVCRRLKGDANTAPIPILMLTAMHGDESRQRGMECGAIGYMTKPFDPDDLMQAIRDTATRPQH